MWFDTIPVFGFSADDGKWVHPSHDCGRDDVPVPPPEGRHPMWNSLVESRIERLQPEVGSKHPCHLGLSKWFYAKSLLSFNSFEAMLVGNQQRLTVPILVDVVSAV